MFSIIRPIDGLRMLITDSCHLQPAQTSGQNGWKVTHISSFFILTVIVAIPAEPVKFFSPGIYDKFLSNLLRICISCHDLADIRCIFRSLCLFDIPSQCLEMFHASVKRLDPRKLFLIHKI